MGVEYYGIGVGSRSNELELLEIASEPKHEHKFHTNDYNGMKTIALKLRNLELCGKFHNLVKMVIENQV